MRWRGSDTERLLSELLLQGWYSWNCMAGMRWGDMAMLLMRSAEPLPDVLGAESLLAATPTAGEVSSRPSVRPAPEPACAQGLREASALLPSVPKSALASNLLSESVGNSWPARARSGVRQIPPMSLLLGAGDVGAAPRRSRVMPL